MEVERTNQKCLCKGGEREQMRSRFRESGKGVKEKGRREKRSTGRADLPPLPNWKSWKLFSPNTRKFAFFFFFKKEPSCFCVEHGLEVQSGLEK